MGLGVNTHTHTLWRHESARQPAAGVRLVQKQIKIEGKWICYQYYGVLASNLYMEE